MEILVAYGTVEGHSRSVAEHVAEGLRAMGQTAVLINTEGAVGPIAEQIGAAILVAPVHVGRYPAGFEAAVRGWRERLSAMPSAFVSVSLAIIDEAAGGPEVAAQYEAALAEHTGWRPARIHHAAGALLFSEYDFFKSWIMRRIGRQHGYASGKDIVFTDWVALDRFVQGFLAEVQTA